MEDNSYYLKKIQSTDIHNIHKGLSDPEITRYYDVHFDTLEETQVQMDWYASLIKDGTGIWWGIYEESTGAFCGAAGYNALERAHQKAEVGLWLLKEFWGRGILKAIMPKVFEKGFLDLGLNRIEGYVVSENEKCKSALAKINFTYEGTMREYEFKDGIAINVDIYAIIKKDWEQNV